MIYLIMLMLLSGCGNESSPATPETTDDVPQVDIEAILTAAEERKQSILNSPTDVEYSGTAYFVSNSGSDYNNGLSPESAWATLNMVNESGKHGRLKDGDAVFFERGGLWRGYIDCAKGVTYSAYGEGEKPKIYGSPENGTGGDKWELWHEQDGVKIWKFYKDISDVGNIVLNNGEECAYRVYAYYNGSEWVASSNDEHAFDIVENLKEDMQFYTTFDLSASKFEQFKREYSDSLDAKWNFLRVDLIDSSGPLYMRCDRGNPGDLFHDIEFQAMPEGLIGYNGLVNTAGNNVIDNLCLRYCVVNGLTIGLDPRNLENNCNNLIQNCEIGWTGGNQHDLNRDDNIVIVCGEGITFATNNNVIQNNYIYQVAQGTFVGEITSNAWVDQASMASGNVFEGNLAENCQYGFWLLDGGFHNSDRRGGKYTEFWNNTVFRDNMLLNMGIDCWYSNEKVYFPGKKRMLCSWAVRSATSPEYAGKMTIEDNIFYLCAEELVDLNLGSKFNKISFSNNICVS